MDFNHKFRYLHLGLPENILQLKIFGDFDGAIQLIDMKLDSINMSGPMRDNLIVQREIIARLSENYPYTEEQAISIIQQNVPDFTEEEFHGKVQNREIQWIYIDGVPHYFDRFYENLIKTDVSFASRVRERSSDSNVVNNSIESKQKIQLKRALKTIRENGMISNKITIRASVMIKEEFFKPGELVRVHLPIPSKCTEQSEICINLIEPSNGQVAPEDAPQRTVCWEEEMIENHPYTVEYSYVFTTKHLGNNEISQEENPTISDISELPPHIVFTPYLRWLADTITEGLDSPLDKAKAIYDFITLKMKYSYMRSYFCLENIAESGAKNLQGDCGVMALLFITLCRYLGIPARWQSGLIAQQDFCGAHDWAKFHTEEYGWMYADPSFGTDAVRNKDEERRQFYFGSIDPFRMVANSAFQEDFSVKKQFWRADPYDNQVGEIETINRGLRYYEYLRTKEVIEFVEL